MDDQWKFNQIRWGEVIWIAVLYIVSARIGQFFSIEPGNVTPIWIPSGLMVALTLIKGPRIWPGVFLGAFAGNIWAYFTLNSATTSLAAIFAGILNGIGDVIGTTVMACQIIRFGGTNYPLTSLKQFFWYIFFAVIIGGFASAFIGASGLFLAGFLAPQEYYSVFSTWLVGDSVGALIFGPLLLAWIYTPKQQYFRFYPVLFFLIGLSGLMTSVVFEVIELEDWLIFSGTILLPLLLVLVIYYDQRAVFTVQTTVCAVAIYATVSGSGPFVDSSPNYSLIQLQGFIAVFSLIIYVLAVIAYERQNSEIKLAQQKASLEKLYRLDALTGLWNRYRIKEYLAFEMVRFKRELRPFGIIMIDVDNFKQINDTYGHIYGDSILIKIGQLMEQNVRESDLLGRWGGEEFLIIVSNSNKESIVVLAEKIRELVENYKFGIDQQLTISLGVTLVHESDTELILMDRVDEALYRSKNRSKNCVTFI